MKNTGAYILDLREIDRTKLGVAGGKGANLGELTRIGELNVPDGFCVSTEAFKRIIGETSSVNELLDQISMLKVEDRDKIRKLSREIRTTIEGIAIPRDMNEEIHRHVSRLGERNAYAVRSSATAEDLPAASFAGQQDTYLNVIGKEAICKHISKCWASLFTERAIIYRLQNGFDHRRSGNNRIHMSVIVQKMVFPEAAGILFTADPVTSNRKVSSIDASFGLGEAMVSGLVSADSYKVRNGKIIDKKIPAKKLAVYALKDGGTKEQEIEPQQQNRQALTDEQIVHLEHIGRKIEAHFGQPQDIEWCLADDIFYIVQSRPITTLYPIPEPSHTDAHENRVYISVGHQQMMTDPMKPLGLSFWLLTTRAPMRVAGGRLFVDVTPMLASPDSRRTIMDTLGQSDPLIKDAFMTILERGDFIKSPPSDGSQEPGHGKDGKVISPTGFRTQVENDPAIASDLIRRSQTSLDALKQNIQTKSGPDLLEFIQEDLRELKEILFDPQSHLAIMAAIDASLWLNEKMNEWLREKNAADALSQSVPNNITSEMGLALLDVADLIRHFPEVVAYLSRRVAIKDDSALNDLVKCNGGKEARDAIDAYLDKYGMRCAGEIDITKTRWSEKPTILLPLILGNIRNFEAGAGKRKFERGREEALKRSGSCWPD